MIKHWNFEIYILLDTAKIGCLLKRGKISLDLEVRAIARAVIKDIDGYKNGLIKYSIQNGFSKIL